jgi:NADH-quinone oxidoreductase subunit G
MKTLTVDGKIVNFTEERNLLEILRKINIEIPSFCYHSELSIYGACRLCIINIEGRGITTSCTTKPEDGMVLRTNTEQLRSIRKTTIELLLSSYNHNCTTCGKSMTCRLQDIAKRLNVTNVRFHKSEKEQKPIDNSSLAITRNPNKCILCGDCVRACEEIQGIGSIEFAFRGADTQVVPAFSRGISSFDCVDCGQCARVCPTGAIIPHSEIDQVWKEIDNPNKIVVVHFAPAVRVAVGEEFGMPNGSVLPGQIVSALRMIGFDKIYDTSFAADLTIVEEANEFIERKKTGGIFPMFTSCCPAWVKYMEQYSPEMLNNLSSCKSPMGMFGAVAKKYLPEILGVDAKNIVVVAIMPCTAKKIEARRPEFNTDGLRDNDLVITTQELAIMIKQSGIKFNDLEPGTFDSPFGHKTGAGVIFGNSGGVTEAAMRYIVEKIENKPLENFEFMNIRGEAGLRETNLNVNGENVKIAVVHGLKNARRVLDNIKKGKKYYDFVEVMSCPGGCVGGAGQPVYFKPELRRERTKGLYEADKMLKQHKSQENEYITELYNNHIGKIGGPTAHKVLHTHYHIRKRILSEGMDIIDTASPKLTISICVGTNCFINGSQEIMSKMLNYVEEQNLLDMVDVKANFCMENCDRGPTVSIGKTIIAKATPSKVIKELESQLAVQQV